MDYREILRSELDDGIIRGAAVWLGDLKSDFVAEGFGLTDENSPYPFTTDTVIDIASVSKVVSTTTALLLLADRGLVDFDRPFTDYLDFKAELPGVIRVRDLATHFSGFSHEGVWPRQYDAPTGPEILENVLRFPPLRKAGEKFEYTCWNFILLGLIAEKVSGRSLTEFTENEIFAPLGMKESTMGRPATDDPARLARTIQTDTPGRISDFIASRVFRDGGSAGNAGVFSTARDLAKFCRCHLDHGRLPDDKRLFSEAMFREISTPAPGPGSIKRSFGWAVDGELTPKSASGKQFYHTGWSGQTIYIDPGLQRFAVVLTARSGDYERAKLARTRVINSLLELHANA